MKALTITSVICLMVAQSQQVERERCQEEMPRESRETPLRQPIREEDQGTSLGARKMTSLNNVRHEYESPPEPAERNVVTQASQECGTHYEGAEPRILNASAAIITEHPWQVAIYPRWRYAADGEKWRLCGGALLSDRFVLTARSCAERFSQDQLTVRLGIENLNSSQEDSGYEERKVRRVISNGPYGLYIYGQHDIALLELSEPVRFRREIAPICLPDKNANFENETAIAIGFASALPTDESDGTVLQKSETEIAPFLFCSQSFRENSFIHISRGMMCSVASNATSPCTGDAGGPLVVMKDGRAELVGIVEGEFTCSNTNTLYTDVARFVDWIKESMGSTP